MKHPTQIIGPLAMAVVAFFLGALIVLVFQTSVVAGFVVLIAYVIVGIIGYRAAYVHTRRAPGEDDEPDPNDKDYQEKWMKKYPNG
jgi:cytoskeletal protein RodZ